MEHVDANWAVVEAARFYYISSFFMTHSAAVIQRVAEHSAANQKCFAMNLAAPFIMQVPPFKAALSAVMPYIDLLVGNESEAAAFAASENWPASLTVSQIAARISALPKASGHRGRVVVITQGAILYDGSLQRIVDRFTTHKIVTLDFDEAPGRERVERFGFPCEVRGPRVVLRIDRGRIADVLPDLLRSEGVRDVSVEDVPLEEIVAELFRSGSRQAALQESSP